MKLLIFICFFIGTLNASLDIEILKDMKYGFSKKTSLDMYIPKANLNKKVIFMVHGGAWRFGDKASENVVKNKLDYWTSKGYIFISTNYKLLPKTNVYKQSKDVAKALSFSQGYLKRYGIDAKDFILMGHSAGAHLLTLLSSNPKIGYKLGVKPWSATISLDSAVYNVVEIMNTKHKKIYDKAFGNKEKYWEKVSPFHQVKEKTVPFLAVCSSKREVSCLQANKYVNKIVSLGTKAKVLKVDYNHKNINKKLGLDNSYTRSVDKFISSISR